MNSSCLKQLLSRETLPALAALVLFFQSAAPACCAERPLPDPVGYAERIWGDLKELPTKPGSWSMGQIYLAGGVVAATTISLVYDEKIRSYNERHRVDRWADLSKLSTHFGDIKYQLPIISGLYVGGLTFGSITMRKIAADAAEASLIAALMINPALNYLTGRNLPSSGEEPSHFRPFTFHRYSFPSGHTSAAFALASVLDTDLRGTFGYWQTPLVYGMAVGVAQSRLYDEKHYLSEVILGGAIGWSIGTWIASKDRSGPPASVTLLPSVNGASLAWKF